MIRLKRNYPKTLDIGQNIWAVKFVRHWEWANFGANVCGFCDPSNHTIYIVMGQSPEERFRTLVHEIMHAIEYEYGFSIPHPVIEKMEEPVRRFLEDNQLVG